jgi:hypothetical protein
MRSKTFARPGIATLIALTATLVGCGGSSNRYTVGDDGRHKDIRHDLTPELMTQHQRNVDVNDEIALTWDNNSRMMWADMHRFFLNDRPSLLTTMPTPY